MNINNSNKLQRLTLSSSYRASTIAASIQSTTSAKGTFFWTWIFRTMHTTTKSTTATIWIFLFLIIYNIFIIYNISHYNNNNSNSNNSLIYLEFVLFQEEFSVLRLNFGFGDGVGLLFLVLKKVKINFVIFRNKLESFLRNVIKI